MIDIKELILHPVQLEKVELVKLTLEKNEKVTQRGLKNNPVKIEAKTWSNVKSANVGEMYLNLNVGFDNSEKGLFNIDITYKGTCRATETANIKEVDLKQFFEIQTLKFLWPYLRETLCDVMIKMDVKPITLPTVDVFTTLSNAVKRTDKLENETEGTQDE